MTCFCIVRVIRSGRVHPDGMDGGDGDEGRRMDPGGPFDKRRIMFCASGLNAYREFSRLTDLLLVVEFLSERGEELSSLLVVSG